MTLVKIEVTAGRYVGATWVGDLSRAPVTMLIPEGIVSRRTTDEAARLRASIDAQLATHARVTVGRPTWGIEVSTDVSACGGCGDAVETATTTGHNGSRYCDGCESAPSED